MAIFGWLAGESITDLISGSDHWIALGLLTIIGVNMIYDGIKNNPTISSNLTTLKYS